MPLDNIDHIETTTNDSSPAMHASGATTTTTSTRTFEKDIHAQRNETTRRVEKEIYSILSWDNPIRSGVIFLLIVGSIILTHSYSLLQIGAALLSIAVGLNLVYVLFTKFYQSVITNTPFVHPHVDVLENKNQNLLNKDKAIHYSSLGVDLAETIARVLTRIILIEDTKTSIKWFFIFYSIYKISAYVSSRAIILFIIISAFIVPRVYMSNKDLVDARIQQGHAIMNTQLKSVQEFTDDKFIHLKNQIQHYIHQKKNVTSTSSSTTAPKKVD